MLVGLVSVFILGGPPYWNEQESKRSFAEKHRECDLVDWGTGEGDSDHVYVHVVLRCAEGRTERRGEVLFQRQKGQWVLAQEDLVWHRSK